MRIRKILFVSTAALAAIAATGANAQSSSITLSCSTGLCVVGVSGTPSTPLKIHWDVDVTGAVPSFPKVCDDKKICSFVCPSPLGYTYPAAVSVTVRDSGNVLLGGASTTTGCGATIE